MRERRLYLIVATPCLLYILLTASFYWSVPNDETPRAYIETRFVERTDPSDLMMSRRFYYLREWTLVVAVYERIASEGKAGPEMEWLVTQSLAALGNRSAAVGAAERALAIDPTHLPSAMAWARLAGRKMSIDELRAKWKEHGFSNTNIDLLIAVSLAQRGDLGEATRYLHRVLDEDNRRADARIVLAEVHHIRGDEASAEAEYALAFSLDHDVEAGMETAVRAVVRDDIPYAANIVRKIMESHPGLFADPAQIADSLRNRWRNREAARAPAGR